MKQSQLLCDEEQRRDEIRLQRDHFNGLDYLEVVDALTLKVYFLNKAPEGLQAANVQITGGRRSGYTDIRVVDIDICRQPRQDLDDCLLVTLDKTGDFSSYTLCLVDLDEYGRSTSNPFPGFDPRYACLDFNFKVDCPQDLDCKTEPICPPPDFPAPEINYLARDYASLRQLILDRLALTIPEWQENHVPDIGIALVEVMAYVGDYLSYYQDAVATEAYLDTARQRISVRRHARLVDYQMHEGCNARTWLQLKTDTDVAVPTDKLAFLTTIQAPLPKITDRLLMWDDLREIQSSAYEVFLSLVDEQQKEFQVYEAHNEIHFYTWGDADCCLSKGTMGATLLDGYMEVEPTQSTTNDTDNVLPPQRNLQLKVGDVLIFEERLGPKTGSAADANLSHRHAVRLTAVEATIDELYKQPILEIAWAEEDALPFALCISAVGPAPYCELIENISVARGNILLVDHGRLVDCEALGTVQIKETAVSCDDPCQPKETTRIPGKFRPVLRKTAVTFSQPLAQLAATKMLAQDPRQAVPRIKPFSAPGLRCIQPDGTPADPAEWNALPWHARRDLLASNAQDSHFVAEIDNDGQAHLRFGNGELGKQPAAGDSFTATYRLGNGQVGNVGAESIRHIVANEIISGVTLSVWNPLPATGGTEPEPMSEVKLFAPHAFRRTIQRAITAEDYATIVIRDFTHKVQRAAASLRWMGSWYEVLVAVDALGQEVPSPDLLQEIQQHLEPFRRIGHDVLVEATETVPLDIALHVCVLPSYLRGHVRAAIQDRLSNRRLSDGSYGFFHPDNLTFGDGVYLSKVVTAVQAITGVESVSVTKFERQYEGPNGEREAGFLKLGPLEIARLDNDPSFPENGRLTLTLEGGR
ncbi:MAG: putative baseplate assembly protein [Ardenticatenaceae bacterium]|nr:MAG: putative baseplate assembly protein [Ardenticatenaceae bacterium]